jgi:hypothetical protein
MNRRVLVSFLPVIAVLGSGCTLGHASMVRRDLSGGVLALHGHRSEAMDDARKQMAEHCQGAYTVVSEEYVPVGQQTTEEAYAGRRRYSSATTTTDVTEYRMTYQCGYVAPAGQSPTYPAGPPQVAPGSGAPPPGAQPAPAAPPPPPPQ